jgi:hypothetical protein
MLWDTGSVAPSQKISFLTNSSSISEVPNTTRIVMLAEFAFRLMATSLSPIWHSGFSAVFNVQPASSLPNSRSGVILGQNSYSIEWPFRASHESCLKSKDRSLVIISGARLIFLGMLMLQTFLELRTYVHVHTFILLLVSI